MNRSNLIIVPVGCPVDKFIRLHGLHFDLSKHWRNTKNDRNYDIIAVKYSEFIPEEGTYDQLFEISGMKWQIVLKLIQFIDLSKYTYIGIYDDDVVTDFLSINHSFQKALNECIPAFQISLNSLSESAYICTRQVDGWYSAKTNFIEIMCPCFRYDMFVKIIKLISSYQIKHAWGIDLVFSDYLKTPLTVYHFCSIFHPSRPGEGSTYNKKEALIEMNYFIDQIYIEINPLWKRSNEITYSYILNN